MQKDDVVVAVFAGHPDADAAIKRLASDGFAMDRLSVIGTGDHTEEAVSGFYDLGDRMRFWGGMWGLFSGGLFLTIPVIGQVVVLGCLAAAVSDVEDAVVVGGLSAIGAAITSIGTPRDSVMAYETAIRADDVLVMAHGRPAEVERAQALLSMMHPTRLDMHPVIDARVALLVAA